MTDFRSATAQAEFRRRANRATSQLAKPSRPAPKVRAGGPKLTVVKKGR
jgi:hypothetical protein